MIRVRNSFQDYLTGVHQALHELVNLGIHVVYAVGRTRLVRTQNRLTEVIVPLRIVVLRMTLGGALCCPAAGSRQSASFIPRVSSRKPRSLIRYARRRHFRSRRFPELASQIQTNRLACCSVCTPFAVPEDATISAKPIFPRSAWFREGFWIKFSSNRHSQSNHRSGLLVGNGHGTLTWKTDSRPIQQYRRLRDHLAEHCHL